MNQEACETWRHDVPGGSMRCCQVDDEAKLLWKSSDLDPLDDLTPSWPRTMAVWPACWISQL